MAASSFVSNALAIHTRNHHWNFPTKCGVHENCSYLLDCNWSYYSVFVFYAMVSHDSISTCISLSGLCNHSAAHGSIV